MEFEPVIVKKNEASVFFILACSRLQPPGVNKCASCSCGIAIQPKMRVSQGKSCRKAGFVTQRREVSSAKAQ